MELWGRGQEGWRSGLLFVIVDLEWGRIVANRILESLAGGRESWRRGLE